MVRSIKKGGVNESSFSVIDFVFAQVGPFAYESLIDFVSARVGLLMIVNVSTILFC